MSKRKKLSHTLDFKRSKGGVAYCLCGLKRRIGTGWPITHCKRNDKRARSAVTGKFVSTAYAKRFPGRTVLEARK